MEWPRAHVSSLTLKALVGEGQPLGYPYPAPRAAPGAASAWWLVSRSPFPAMSGGHALSAVHFALSFQASVLCGDLRKRGATDHQSQAGTQPGPAAAGRTVGGASDHGHERSHLTPTETDQNRCGRACAETGPSSTAGGIDASEAQLPSAVDAPGRASAPGADGAPTVPMPATQLPGGSARACEAQNSAVTVAVTVTGAGPGWGQGRSCHQD